MYGMTDVDEFMAEVFSNPKFQQALKKINAPAGSSVKTAWAWFIRTVRGILGLKPGSQDALSRALDIGAQVMHENKALKAGGQGAVRWNEDAARLAPNGKPSNLTEQQYAQVRTPEFKAWFGDWEAAALHDFLNGDPLATLNTSEAPHQGFAKLRDWALGIFKEYGNYANNPALGKVLMDERAIRDSIGHKINPFKAVAFKAVPDVIENGRIVFKESDNNLDSYYISAPVIINGTDDILTVLVHRDANTQRMYLHSVTTKESLLTVLESSANAKASERSGSALSRGHIYNILHRSITFNDQSSKVIDQNGEPLVVYHGTENGGFTSIRPDKGDKHRSPMSFAAATPETAQTYSGVGQEIDLGKAFEDGEKQPGIYSLFLNIRNPREAKFDGANWDGSRSKPIYSLIKGDDYTGESVYSKDEATLAVKNGRADEYREETNIYQTTNTVGEVARKKGFDGAIIRQVLDDGGKGSRTDVDDVFIFFDSNQAKSATQNTGAFDAGNTDIRYNVAADWYEDNAPNSVKSFVANAFTSSNSTSWVSVFNTQYHKAEKWAAEGKPLFKRVFDLGQKFIGDTSKFGVMAQNAAPTLFHEIRSVKEAKDALLSIRSHKDLFGKTHKADVEAVAAPLYEGTLSGGGSPLQGKRFSEAELRTKYQLTPRQIKLYNEALAAVNVSLNEMAKSIIAKHAKSNDVSFDREMSLAGMAISVKRALKQKIGDLGDAAADRLYKTIEDIDAIVEKNEALQTAGYFPLMRFGKHTVTAKDSQGNVQFFGMYDGAALIPNSGQYQANKVANEIRAEHPEWTVTTGINNTEKYKLYAGMNMEAVQLFADHMDAESKEPFQEYLRQATNNRSLQRRLIHRKGTPGFDRDVRRTLAQFIVSNSRATASSYHLGDMRLAAEAADQDGGDIGKEAVKLYQYVSEPGEEMQALRGYMFFNFLGGSIASAMVNLTQIPLMTFPFLSQYAKIGELAGMLASAAKLAYAVDKMPKALREAFEKAEMDGVTAPQEIHQLTATAANNVFSGSKSVNTLLRVWGAPFAMAESFNRRTTFIAAYQIAEKMDAKTLRATGHRTAFDFAENVVNQTQGIYNKGNRMNVGRGALGATLMTFKQYSIMYLELLKRLPPKQQLLMIGLLLLGAGGGGLPFVEDVEDIIDTIGQWLGYATNSKRTVRNAVTSVLGDTAGDVAINGAASQMGIDLHSRFGMQNLLPGTGLMKMSSVDKTRDVTEFFGPAASVINNVGNSIRNLATGNLDKAARDVLPNAATNAIKGAKMIESGYGEDMKGRRTIPVNAGEGLAKAVGFNPKSVADFGALKAGISQDQRMVQVKREEFTSAMADAILSGDTEARKEAMLEMMRWNRDNDPSMRVVVNQAAVMARVRAARSEGISRFLKTVPKAMKQSAREELI